MPKIKYADMHCDTVSVCCNSESELSRFDGQINTAKLKKSGCALQCFALFTEGENAAADFEKYAAFYAEQLSRCKTLKPVLSYSDLQAALKSKKTAAVLTVENLGFLNGDAGAIPRLKELGVRMASLVWNNKNAFAYPNLVYADGIPDYSEREERGLTAAGREAVRLLNENRIILDVSHLSDGGVEEALVLSEAPVVASHSDCDAVTPLFRNLTDGQIKAIADKGGVAGLNFSLDFIGAGDVCEKLYLHYAHMVKVGGEDFPALGSDFDGILAYPEMCDCTRVQPLLKYFRSKGVKPRLLEKLAFGNFARVFKEVVG